MKIISEQNFEHTLILDDKELNALHEVVFEPQSSADKQHVALKGIISKLKQRQDAAKVAFSADEESNE